MKSVRRHRFLLIATIGILLTAPVIYNLPPVQDRLGWRVAELVARAKYALWPPEQEVFVPQEVTTSGPTAIVSLRIATPVPGQRAPIPTSTIPLTGLSSTPTRAPVPGSLTLTGFQHEYQTWNNCGPATLAMALSYWGWKGDQRPIAAFTKPNPRDKNVMPYELSDYVQQRTQFLAIVRVGGDVEMLERFLAASLPVMIEKGFEGREFDGWMGHYVLVTGYDRIKQRFTVQDSYYGPDQAISYAELRSNWRAFDFTYLVIYPAERQAEVTRILGPQAEDEYNNRHAAQVASDEIYILTGRDQFFAWFNRGTSLVRLQDYAGAAAAYDEAFALYPSIPAKQRPWRMMWYQTGPYWAYYYSGRFQDVITLANTTLEAMSEPVLEESYYWRALAREATGDEKGAIRDVQTSLKYHPGFEPATEQLQKWGLAP